MTGEKRAQSTEESPIEQKIILLDIEGTTTSVTFVKDTLFSYVRDNLEKYVADKWEDEEFKSNVTLLKEQAKKDVDEKLENAVAIAGSTPEEERTSLIKNVLWQMDNDRKTGALKQLQGHMWRQAYNSGSVKGHVYDDVKEALEQWTTTGRKIYIYSSGSVEAQKLLFGHSEKGDLLKYLSDFFDTEVGAKQESASYQNIAKKINVEASSILFLTDIVKEAEAAKEAGMRSMLVVRKGNAPLSDDDQAKFTTIESFSDLSFETSAKRQKIEDAPPVEPEKQPEEKKDKTEMPEEPVVPMDTSDIAEPVAAPEQKEENGDVSSPVVTEEAETKVEKKIVEETKVDEKKPKEKEPSEEIAKVADVVESATEKPVEIEKPVEEAEKSVEIEKPVETEKEEKKDEAVVEEVKEKEETTTQSNGVDAKEKLEEEKPKEEKKSEEVEKVVEEEKKVEKVADEEEKKAEEPEKKMNGESKTEDEHPRNGVEEKEKTSNGETIKVKKVVEDEKAESDVVPPVAVSATS